eukprot:TRINITY_DN19836_c1_g5_i1.p1 TRINITY_DN19836_c1_g5~~TRINITY_DN19836_c1_g5_i1.p1  ORF type:complete len:933 (-),score=256.02 TRINITY_DN19836_c1_g5_i1:210-3008(-)
MASNQAAVTPAPSKPQAAPAPTSTQTSPAPVNTQTAPLPANSPAAPAAANSARKGADSGGAAAAASAASAASSATSAASGRSRLTPDEKAAAVDGPRKGSTTPRAPPETGKAAAVTTRKFARWAIGYWDDIKDLFRPVDPTTPRNGGGSTLLPEGLRRSRLATAEGITPRGLHVPAGAASRSSTLLPPGVEAATSPRRASSIGGGGSVRGSVTAGSRRPSAVAGASGRRPSSAPRNTSRAFVEELRGGGGTGGAASKNEPRRSHVSLHPRTQSAAVAQSKYKEVTAKEWEAGIRKLGFQGNCQTVFKEIRKEMWGVSDIVTMRTEADEHITMMQLLQFEKRPSVVMCTLAELMRLRRGTALRSWRLDADMQGSGRVSRTNWMRMCRASGFDEQGKIIFDAYKSSSEDDKTAEKMLSFRDFDPDEYANLEEFATVLLTRSGFDHEKAWNMVELSGEGCATFEEFRHAAKTMKFQGLVRPIFDGLDASGQGRLWREEFEYLWLVTLPAVRKKRGTLQGLRLRVMGDPDEDDVGQQAWEPSEFEGNARDFARWASHNWPALSELFIAQERRRRPGVSADELERWLHMLGYVGDVGAVFMEISRERPVRGDYDPSVVTSAQFQCFRQRRDRIALEEFNAHLLRRRGSVLRAWKLDIDGYGSGVIEQVDFYKACRRVGYGNDILCVWDHIRMVTTDVGPQPTVSLENICLEEADNLQDFAELILERAKWSPKQAWQLLDDNGDDVITLSEFKQTCDDLGFQGDAELLFTGLASNAQGFLWQEDMDYLWTIALLRARKKWELPPIYAVSALAQTSMKGPFNLLGQLGLDSRGLTRGGETITMTKLVMGLQRLGFLGSAMRAGIELVWKVLTGHDANPHLSAKNIFLKNPPQADGEKPKWNESHLILDRDKCMRTTYSKAACCSKRPLVCESLAERCRL